MQFLKKFNPRARTFGHHLLLWCLLAIMLLGVSLPHSAAAFKRVNQGDALPEVKLKTLTGKEVTLSDYKGKVLTIVFWKNPCERCEMMLRTAQKLYTTYKTEKDMELVAVYCPQTDEKITDTEIADIKKIMADNAFDFPVLLDEGLKTFSAIGVITMPSLAIVDKEGKMGEDQPGYPLLNGEKLVTEKIKIALGFAPPEKKIAKVSYKPKGQAAKRLTYGRNMMSLGFADKAIKEFKEAIEEDPDFAPPHALLAELYEKQGKIDDAMVEFNTAIALTPDDVNLHRDYAFYLLRQKQYAESRVEFEVVTALAANSGDGFVGLGMVDIAEDNLDAAEKNLLQAIATYEGGDSGGGDKGDLFASMIKKRTQNKVRLNPLEAEVHAELAKVLNAQGKKEEANEELLKAIDKYKKIIDKLMEKSKEEE